MNSAKGIAQALYGPSGHIPLIQQKKDAAIPFKLAGCSNCEERRLPALDFHHRDPKLKSFAIAQGMRDPSIDYYTFIEELEKCIVLCANCHRCLHSSP
jgi:hypothetical protein